MTVELLTRDGQAVEKVETPPFKTPPDALFWGMRLFIRRNDGKYYEGYLHIVSNPPALQGVPEEPEGN